jgi:energy-coupling factor transport system substrate-specific component
MRYYTVLSKWVTPAIYLASAVFFILALIYPFLSPLFSSDTDNSSNGLAGTPIIFSLLLGLCIAVLVYVFQGNRLNTKIMALLGILVAFNAALRFIEVGIPGPGGFSPVFFLIIMTGYIFGAQFGFLMGTLTMLVSAVITGGIGPWLPGQMITAGWVGLSAALLSLVLPKINNNLKSKPNIDTSKIELVALIIFGFFWGIAYGILMNLWTWQYINGPQSQFITAEAGISTIIQRYLSFYIITSLIWDISRSIGIVLMILALGIPTLKALRRFHGRFYFSHYNSEINDGKNRDISFDDIAQPVRTP